MQLKETAFAYNTTTGGHSNSDWGAEIGQGVKKLMNVEGVSEILNGMLYYKFDNIDEIQAILGKGNRTPQPLSSYLPETSIVIASLFEKVRVNGALLPNQKFIMFITKDERKFNNKGEPNVHYQRRGLKFSDKALFKGESINQECIKAICKSLDCSENGSWIITNIDFIDDELNFTAVVVDKENPHDFSTKEERSSYLNRVKFQELLSKLKKSKYNGGLEPLLLYGPPGTGKTHSLQDKYIEKFDPYFVEFTTFHQSFSYEEFVEGLKPILDENREDVAYRIEKGVFYNACEKAAKLAGYGSLKDCIGDSKENRKAQFKDAIDNKRLVLLCIDEINRGNVAAIFGDLISLIEPSKRLGAENELILTLPYSKERFGVPANLLIVGTMNTADRSIQLLDSALRRRFKFKELLPDYSVIKNQKAAKILKSINARVRALINKDSQIGHSYFIDIPQSSEDENTLIMKALVGKIIPLLEEYFYNDHTKIRFVLSEDDDTPHTFYVKDKAATDVYNEFAKIADFDEKMDLYELNPDVEKATEDKELANGFLDRWN